LGKQNVRFSPSSALQKSGLLSSASCARHRCRIARSGGRYTREAGVRNCERELSTPIRKAVKELMIS